MAASAPFPIDPFLSAIAIAHRNTRLYIADRVLPRSGVGRQEYKYQVFPPEETFRLPASEVGRKGRLNEIEIGWTEVIDKTLDFGLEEVIPIDDIDQAASAGLTNPVDIAVQTLTDYILLGHEKRTADLVFDPAQYPSSNKVQLSGNDQWSAAHDDSNPIDDILTGADAMLLPPTHMAIGSDVWRKLRVHPKIVAAIHGNEGETGIVTREQVAKLFELDELLIGQGRLNTAKYGQTAVLGRVWGKHCLLYHLNPSATAMGGVVSFGATFQYKARFAGSRHDPEVGLRGATRVRTGESVKEAITAAQAGYLIEDAVS